MQGRLHETAGGVRKHQQATKQQLHDGRGTGEDLHFFHIDLPWTNRGKKMPHVHSCMQVQEVGSDLRWHKLAVFLLKQKNERWTTCRYELKQQIKTQ